MRKPARIRGIFGFLLVIALWAPLHAEDQSAKPESRETWMGVYMNDQKIGYLKMAVTKSKYNGQDALTMENLVHTNIKMLGAEEMQQDIKTIVYTDPNQKPLHEDFEMSSGGTTTKVDATFQPTVVKCHVVSGGTTTDKDVPIPAGVSLLGDSAFYGTGGKKLAVGGKSVYNYFNPLTLTIDAVAMEVERKEKVTLKDKTFDTYVVKSTTSMGEVTSWQEESGDVVKMVALMGMMMVRESMEEAMSNGGDYRPPSDFAVLTSVKADTDVQKPRQVSRLELNLLGVEEAGRQRRQAEGDMVPKDGHGAANYVITAELSDGKKSPRLPFHSEDLQPYMAPAPYIQSDDASIKKQAQDIVGSESAPFYAASKIRKWVHEHMRQQANMGVVRSAVDVMNNKAGVCRDYAILYTALARAAGIPTRIVAGLVFFDGSFYYHAWAESYTGAWTPFDATLDSDFVDATHIKLTQGDATSMFDIAKVIGGLKAQIVNYGYLEK